MKLTQYARLAIIGSTTAAMIAFPAVVGALEREDFDAARPEGTATVDSDDLGLFYGEDIGLGTRSLQETIASIIRVVLSLLGIVAVVIILMGGFKWMTAGGNDEEVKKARKLITNGIIGLAIILMAFAISKFVIDSLTTAVAG